MADTGPSPDKFTDPLLTGRLHRFDQDSLAELLPLWVGVGPADLRAGGLLKVDWFSSPLGPMVAVADGTSLHLLEFVDRRALPREMQKLFQACKGSLGLGRTAILDQTEEEMTAYFAGRRGHFDVPIALHGTGFTKQVWRALCTIPAGETMSYGALAERMGRSAAVRAVARANGANQIGVIIPCHRVIGADGSLTGYGGGLWRKHRLIEHERQYRAGA